MSLYLINPEGSPELEAGFNKIQSPMPPYGSPQHCILQYKLFGCAHFRTGYQFVIFHMSIIKHFQYVYIILFYKERTADGESRDNNCHNNNNRNNLSLTHGYPPLRYEINLTGMGYFAITVCKEIVKWHRGLSTYNRG